MPNDFASIFNTAYSNQEATRRQREQAEDEKRKILALLISQGVQTGNLSPKQGETVWSQNQAGKVSLGGSTTPWTSKEERQAQKGEGPIYGLNNEGKLVPLPGVQRKEQIVPFGTSGSGKGPRMLKSKAIEILKSGGKVSSDIDLVDDTALPKGTAAQTAVDRAFGRDYAAYAAGGGYADIMGQIDGLDGVLSDLQLGGKNLTGPMISAQPDLTRKRVNPDSWDAQQTVERSVQRTLKQTLGGQFTEKEGMLFLQRGYDPALPEEKNAKRLERAIASLKTMALAKQDAVDYFEENGTLTGFKGTLYRLKDGEMVQATKEDFFKMMGIKKEGKGTTEQSAMEQSKVDELPSPEGVKEGSYLRKDGVRTHVLKGGKWQPL